MSDRQRGIPVCVTCSLAHDTGVAIVANGVEQHKAALPDHVIEYGDGWDNDARRVIPSGRGGTT